MLRKQRGRCAVCKRRGEKLVVDHAHGTTPVLVRALVCTPCNLALGHVRESVGILKAMVRYVERWGRRKRRSR